MKHFTLFLLIFLAYSCNFNPVNSENIPTRKPLLELVNELNVPLSDIQVKVYKSEYKLEVWNDQKELRSYKVVLGENPEGQKFMEGDKKTPEGSFKIRNLYPHAKWSKFIWFDYPNEQSVLNHEQAKADKIIPQSATIGGEVGIHGVPKGKDSWIENGTNWTLGCVSLTNEDINDLYDVLQKGTEITILP